MQLKFSSLARNAACHQMLITLGLPHLSMQHVLRSLPHAIAGTMSTRGKAGLPATASSHFSQLSKKPHRMAAPDSDWWKGATHKASDLPAPCLGQATLTREGLTISFLSFLFSRQPGHNLADTSTPLLSLFSQQLNCEEQGRLRLAMPLE